MDEERKALERLLDDGEDLLYIIKPNKGRFVWTNNIATVLSGTIFVSPFIILPILMLTGVIPVEGGTGPGEWVFLAFSCLFLFLIYSGVAFNGMRYKHTVYGVTPTRLLLVEGAINMSYRTYDLTDIATIDVRIGFLDRVLKPETGSLCFFTVATAMNQNNAQNSRFGGPKACIFQGVEDPYGWYKRINELKKECEARKRQFE